MEPVVLRGKKELDIYINPQRQRLLRLMTIEGRPATPKHLSDKMGISPSSVQHHLSRLMELGLVELDHTELIRGITAHYYIAPPRTISLGCVQADEHSEQRLATIQSGLNGVFDGVTRYVRSQLSAPELRPPLADILCGITRLKPEEAMKLQKLIHNFLQEHEPTRDGADPWEYALIAYPVQEEEHA